MALRLPSRLRHPLGVGADPVDDAVLVEVRLVGERGGRTVPDALYEGERRTVVVVPLLSDLGEGIGRGSDTCGLRWCVQARYW